MKAAEASGAILATSFAVRDLSVFRSARFSSQPAGNPPRRAGNFHSLARMKVTKARGLDTGDLVYFPFDQTVGRRPNAPSPCPVGCLRARPTQHRLHRASMVWSVSPLGQYQSKCSLARPDALGSAVVHSHRPTGETDQTALVR